MYLVGKPFRFLGGCWPATVSLKITKTERGEINLTTSAPLVGYPDITTVRCGQTWGKSFPVDLPSPIDRSSEKDYRKAPTTLPALHSDVETVVDCHIGTDGYFCG